jgi:hypothetical protein
MTEQMRSQSIGIAGIEQFDGSAEPGVSYPLAVWSVHLDLDYNQTRSGTRAVSVSAHPLPGPP